MIQRGTREDVLQTIGKIPHVKDVRIVDSGGGKVRLAVEWLGTADHAEPMLRDALYECLAAGVWWEAEVTAHARRFTVRAATKTIWMGDSSGQFRVGTTMTIARQMPSRFKRAIRRALWWRRTDHYVVTRIGRQCVELEPMRWVVASLVLGGMTCGCAHLQDLLNKPCVSSVRC